MKQEDIELLKLDLCAKLPYKVKARYYGSEEEMYCIDDVEGIEVTDRGHEVTIGQYSLPFEDVKPLLRRMDSMTEDEAREYRSIDCGFNRYNWMHTERVIDWLNKHHFDYRGLIDKGLAIADEDNDDKQ